MAVGRSNANYDDKVPKKYPARLYQADSGEPISALVSVQGDDLLISAIEGEHIHKFEAAKVSASGDSISFLLSSLQVKGGGSEGDKVVLIEPESQATVIINSHDFLGELRAVMPAKQIKGNFQRLKFNRLQASFRNGLVAVFIAGAVLLFAFVVVSGFLYESKHPHRDDVSLADQEGEVQEARPPNDSSTEAVEPVSEEYAVTYYESEEMSEEANQALTKYLTAFRTKTQSKLRKFIAKPMANGTVVEIAVGANGNLVSSCIAQSAGVSNDKLVLKVVRGSFPLQPLPKGVQSPIRAKILLK